MNIDLSPNDRSIIGAICHYPNMDLEEKQSLIRKLHDPRLIRITETLAGIRIMDELNAEERGQLVEIESWRDNKRVRIKNEQIEARRRSNEPTSFAKRLLEMHQKGQVTDEHLFLYGIAGDMPVRSTYRQMTDEERRQIWENRLDERYGIHWRGFFTRLPKMFDNDSEIDDWIKEGF